MYVCSKSLFCGNGSEKGWAMLTSGTKNKKICGQIHAFTTNILFLFHGILENVNFGGMTASDSNTFKTGYLW